MLSFNLFSLTSLPTLVSAGARFVSISQLNTRDDQGNASLGVTVSPNNALVFDPPNVNASIGQMINFNFPTDMPVSVTQSKSFNEPCTFLNLSDGTVGFDSDIAVSIRFTIQVTDLEPIYFHCKHPGHCGSGMVGTINAPLEGNTSGTAFQGLAMGLGSRAPNDTSGQSNSGNAGASGQIQNVTSTSTPDTSTSAASLVATHDLTSSAFLAALVACVTLF